MNRRSLLVVLTILFAAPVLAVPPPWTAVGATAVIDESSVPLYARTQAFLGFNATGVGVLTAYFNVTDMTATAFPEWSTLEISVFDNSNQSWVRAFLYKLDRCNGTVTLVCSVSSLDNSANTCYRCNFTEQIDFSNYNYYVTTRMFRGSTTLAPKLFGVRIR